jgi:hypothetical protein
MIWGGVMTEEHARLIEQAAAQYLAVIEKAARAAGEPCTCEHVTSVFFVPLYSEPIFLVIPSRRRGISGAARRRDPSPALRAASG